MSRAIPGIHHVTAITGNPQQNLDFYTGVLGLRLVKLTVNFDDPGAYHLYYGDAVGHPGTILTFFAWPGAPGGRPGTGQVGVTSLAIPQGALEYWHERLSKQSVPVQGLSQRFGEQVRQAETDVERGIAEVDDFVVKQNESAVADEDVLWTEVAMDE